jgi:hypothetical protein
MKLSGFVALATAASLAHGAVLEARACASNNCVRQLKEGGAPVLSFCATYTTAVHTETTGLPPIVSQCDNSPSKISSACSCVATGTLTTTSPTTTSTSTTPTTPPAPTDTAAPGCSPGNNCYRQLAGAGADASAFCATYTTTTNTATAGLPTFVAKCSGATAKISSACSCFAPAPTGAPSGTSVIGTTVWTPLVGTTTVNDVPESVSASPAPPIKAAPLNIGAIDGTEGTPDSIKSGPVKKVLSGRNNGDGTYLLSVTDVTGKSGKALINLPDFAFFIDSVTCASNTIGIKFKTAGGYAVAKADWKAGMAGLTAGTAYCGAADHRTYFTISAVTASDATLVVTLQITEVGISDIASKSKIQYGTLAQNQVSQAAPEVGTAVNGFWSKIAAAAPPPAKRDSGSTVIHFGPGNLSGGLPFLFGYFPGVDELGGVVECQRK